jgi:uncharacterized phiE125 gp8 family phage protein
MLIATATDMVEKYCSRTLITQTLEVEFIPSPPEILPSRIILPYASPLQDVNYVKSVEQDGSTHTQSADIYEVDTYAVPGRVQLLMGFWWDYYVFGKYRIQYVCGYGDTSDKIPAPIRTAILVLVSQLYQSREVIDYTMSPQVEMLLQDYKLDSFDYTGGASMKWSPFGLQSSGY